MFQDSKGCGVMKKPKRPSIFLAIWGTLHSLGNGLPLKGEYDVWVASATISLIFLISYLIVSGILDVFEYMIDYIKCKGE